MCRDDLDARKSIQEPFEDHVRQRDRRVERKPDVVAEGSRSVQSLGGILPSGRVHEDHRPEVLGSLPEGIEFRIDELAAIHVGADNKAPHVQLRDRLVHLLGGHLGELEGHVAESHEAVGMCRANRGDLLVLHLDELRGESGLGPIEELTRMHAEHVHVDTLAIHLPKPPIDPVAVHAHRAAR